MEKREIDPVLRKKVQKESMIVILAMGAVIIAYVIYALISQNLNIILFEIMLSVFVIVFAILSDVVEPKRLGLFENMTIGQRGAYMKILIMDVVGIGALIIWIAGMHSENESLMPVVIYFLATQMKRKFRPEFEGTEEDEEGEEEEENEENEAPVSLEDSEIPEENEDSESLEEE